VGIRYAGTAQKISSSDHRRSTSERSEFDICDTDRLR
jgi:hypothetical protein